MATARRGDGRARRRAPTSCPGPVLVLFAMALVGIMAAAGLAFDLGRFYSEKRFLQNAADAGALAVANALIRGESTTDAEAEGRDVLARNLLSSPTGTVASVALSRRSLRGWPCGRSVVPVERHPHLRRRCPRRDPERRQLHIRAGRRSDSTVVGGRALVKTKGDLLPIAVRHYINAPGPFRRARRAVRRGHEPLPGPRRDGEHLVSREHDRRSLRLDPEPGLAFNATTPDDDPVNHGPIIALVGQGASPSNAASFRGFVALDIRNFQFDATLERLLQRRHCRDEREHAQGHGGGLGRDRVPGSRLPGRNRPARPERPGRDHRRQLVGHRRRRDQRAI